MTDIYQIAIVGMQDANRRMDAISQNAASASLPGYRRHVVSGRPFTAALAGLDPAAAGATAADIPQQLQLDLRPGPVNSTGRSLDMALDSDDLFFALTDGAQTWLTRSGAFHLNQDGVLVGEGGLRVVGTDGDIHLPGSDVTIESDGRISQQGMTVSTVQLFRPNDRMSLMAAQGSLIEAAAGIQPAEAEEGRVRGGTLESSNTDVGTEMIGLMSIARQFESLSRVIQGYDGLFGRAIEKLAEI